MFSFCVFKSWLFFNFSNWDLKLGLNLLLKKKLCLVPYFQVLKLWGVQFEPESKSIWGFQLELGSYKIREFSVRTRRNFRIWGFQFEPPIYNFDYSFAILGFETHSRARQRWKYLRVVVVNTVFSLHFTTLGWSQQMDLSV